MKMSGHEAVRQAPDWRPLLRLPGNLKEPTIVFRIVKQPHPPYAAVQNMENNSAGGGLASPWHSISVNQDACQLFLGLLGVS